ncbi:MAG: LuxR C-terminal-related transcriptional regulator [Synergistaceae bacterium]|nr:LuxR C-terminal-related transcriptional regulator [Synergistaceae bacterium]
MSVLRGKNEFLSSPFWIFVVLMTLYFGFSKGYVLAFMGVASPRIPGGTMFAWIAASMALGNFTAAMLGDGRVTKKFFTPRRMIDIGAVATLILTAADIFVPSAPFGAHVALCLAVNYLQGCFTVVLCADMLRRVPFNRRGTAFGLGFGLSTLINLPARLEDFPFPAIQTIQGQLVYSFALMIICALFLFLPDVQRAFTSHARTETSREGEVVGRRFGFMVFLIMVCYFFLYTSYGIFNTMTDNYIGTHTVSFEYARIADVFANIIVGVLCDVVGRGITLSASGVLLICGAVGCLFEFDGRAAVAMSAITIVGAIGYSDPIRVIFVDVSAGMKRPMLVCALGFICHFLFQATGGPAAVYTQHHGVVAQAAIIIALCVIATPGLTLLVEILRNINVERQSSMMNRVKVESACSVTPSRLGEILGPCNLTKREQQIYDLSVAGKSVPEIAEFLFISEATVKSHVNRTLKKTGTKNRSEWTTGGGNRKPEKNDSTLPNEAG